MQTNHVRSCGAAQAGLAQVRVLAVPPASHMVAERTLEQAGVARSTAFSLRTMRTRLATLFSLGKATGFAG